jgi:hypothetical protein
MTSPVPLYCSHSYRPADRELNIHFWKLLHAAGFTVTVDPKSTVLSTTSLELMMARSAGFVAVVTHRPEVPVYECSPFAVHEYGLAFQARKPRLVPAGQERLAALFRHRRHDRHRVRPRTPHWPPR